ncbi:MAG: electron transport complex subunit RsxC [Clostridia bacterium]|nr:electron transport complex subunit RsxC [Clostridia bacterium]
MGLLSFRGGIHPPHAKKSTEKKPVEHLVEPKVVVIPLHQHIGAPCEPVVNVGDHVKVGQKIGNATSFVSAPVHSSVSGVVKEIGPKLTLGGKTTCVVIESDGLNTISEEVKPKGDISTLDGKEILEIIKEAGIVGMGGAGFPTHVKLSPPPNKPIDYVILNGAECEPYLTADHRLMLENPESIIYGLKALMKVLGVTKGYVGIENNKMDAIEKMTKAAEKEAGIEVVALKTKYPQGAEKQLIYACTKRQVPSGGLPLEAGVVVSNVATASAVSEAIQTGMPLVQRICTVTGSGVKEPKNVMIKTGTMLSEIVEQCGGLTDDISKLIWGGPMMGISMSTLNIPATKTASGILCLNEADATIPEKSDCIKCGKCVDICPAFIQPMLLDAYALRSNYDQAEKLRVLDCIECGSCSFVCPAKRPLLHSIRVAKREVLARKKRV